MARPASADSVDATREHSKTEGTRTATMQRPKRENAMFEGFELSREDLERLGRERPSSFTSIWSELAFCYSIIASQFMGEYFVSGFNVLLPTLQKDLSIPSGAIVWPSAAFAVVTSAFLLPFGRLADMYDGYIVFTLGLAWFTIWSLVAGFSQNELMLDLCRALQGLGPAAFLPSGIQLLGSTYRPGPRKNLVFSIYGGSAPLGFFFGVFISGLAGSFLSFGWYFWIGAILIFTTLLAALWTVPNDFRKEASMKMDWLGSGSLVTALILIVFALTDGSHAPQGWSTPYIYTLLIVGMILLAGFCWIEGWKADNPLLPPDLFEGLQIKVFFFAICLSFGCLGTFLLYSTLYMQGIMGATPIQVAAWYVPMCAGGVFISVLGGYVLHLINGTILIVIFGLGWVVASVLFALVPVGGNYWAWVFPAMIGATVGIDIAFNVSNVYITTSLSSSRQGVAGGMCNALLYLGIAVLLAFADTIQVQTRNQGLKASYQNVFWFELGVSTLSLILFAGFVRISRAVSDLTYDEREAQRAEVKAHANEEQVAGDMIEK